MIVGDYFRVIISNYLGGILYGKSSCYWWRMGWMRSCNISYKKQDAEVVILERTDLLIGLGNVGGIMRNNGRYTATEEAIALRCERII